MAKYSAGSVVEGQVTGIEKYGAFVHLDDDYSGLIHISEVSNDFVGDIHKFLEVNDRIFCEVLEVDEDNKQIKLSIKNINYKFENNGKVQESRLGFLPLKNHLDKWIKDKLSEIEK